MKVRYRERALADLEEISAYISERSPIGAINVLAAIHAAVSELTSNPLASRHTSDPEVRVKVVRRYLYKIFYAIGEDEIEILHVRHGARRPWIAE
jgi:plasmid stabilization system protein ParE